MGCRMMRWLGRNARKWFAGSMATLVALGVLSGCQRVFLTEAEYKDCHSHLLPAKLEQDFCPITGPVTPMTAAPATIANPDRMARPMTLPEAIAIALEN